MTAVSSLPFFYLSSSLLFYIYLHLFPLLCIYLHLSALFYVCLLCFVSVFICLVWFLSILASSSAFFLIFEIYKKDEPAVCAFPSPGCLSDLSHKSSRRVYHVTFVSIYRQGYLIGYLYLRHYISFFASSYNVKFRFSCNHSRIRVFADLTIRGWFMC